MIEFTASVLAFLCFLCVVVFFAPAFIAFVRGHRHRWPILVTLVLFGWTVLGWGACLIWAVWPKRS